MWNIRCQAITYSVLVLCIFKYVECAVKIVGSRDDQLNLIGGNTTTTISHTEDLLSFTRDQSTPLFNLNSTLLSFSTTLQLDGGLELTSGKESEDEESGPWALLSLDTFDSPASKWSQQERSFCGTSSDMFLGGHFPNIPLFESLDVFISLTSGQERQCTFPSKVLKCGRTHTIGVLK
eukprot:GHVL01004577.1.p1 GENE.GHVL01004577.1~~GHVL01004577.1.p1  ORF type:complete len:178 (+),score=9.35 GHVL01004577.1:83-616(+)